MMPKEQLGKDVIIVAMVVIFMGTLAIFFLSQDAYQKVTSFQDCVQRGFAVMESHPRQCRANGTTFVETLQQPIEVATTTTAETASNPEPVVVLEPLPDTLIASPLTVTGQAVGSWYFEASFPVRLLDGNGEELAVQPAQAQGDWMTTSYVPFAVTLEFEKPSTDTGILVLEKDNPSGLPENDASIKIPVSFK
jgi:Immunoglobulin-like domain of bacterial spore germination